MEAVKTRSRRNNYLTTANSYIKKAEKSAGRGSYLLAKDYLQKASIAYKSAGDTDGSKKAFKLFDAVDHRNDAKKSERIGDYRGAKKDLEQAASIYEKTGYKKVMLLVKAEIAELDAKIARFHKMRAHLENLPKSQMCHIIILSQEARKTLQ